MPAKAQVFTLFRRKNRKYYTVRFRKPDSTFVERCSGQTSQSAARNWALLEYQKLLKEFDDNTKALVTYRNLTLGEYARTFYDYAASDWIKGKLARGGYYTQRAAISAAHIVEKHIIPQFGTTKVGDIHALEIERWLLSLPDKASVSKATANRVYTILRTMIKELYRLGIIDEDPTLRVKQFSVQYVQRGILTPEEVRRLFSDDTVWECDLIYRTINLIAAITALRSGEILALRWCDIKGNYIDVEHSWSEVDGLKTTKTNKSRKVPISRKIIEVLSDIRPSDAKDTDLIFHGKIDRDHPIDKKAVLKHLRRALVKIGISEQEQTARKLCFHSWRHFAATYLRRLAPDHEVRAMTGHADTRMLDHYSGHATEIAFNTVIKAQETLIS
jgi:integrase